MPYRFHLPAILAIACCWSALCADEKPAGLDEALRAELKRRVKEDQDARMAMIKWMQEKKVDDPAKAKHQTDETLVKRVNEIDEANTKWLKEIIEKRGWPGKSLVGADGASNAWLLVQHADRDPAFQKKCLELMTPLVAKDEVAKTDVAYLTDRVLVKEKKKQLYGTQFHTVDGKLVPQPIEDEANVDKRRKDMGMSTMAEYRLQIEKMYKK